MTGSLENTAKCRGTLSKSLQLEIDTTVNLCKQGLNARFGILITANKNTESKSQPVYSISPSLA